MFMFARNLKCKDQIEENYQDKDAVSRFFIETRTLFLLHPSQFLNLILNDNGLPTIPRRLDNILLSRVGNKDHLSMYPEHLIKIYSIGYFRVFGCRAPN